MTPLAPPPPRALFFDGLSWAWEALDDLSPHFSSGIHVAFPLKK